MSILAWLTAVSASTCVNNHHSSLGSHLGRGAIQICIFSVILLGFRTFYSSAAVPTNREKDPGQTPNISTLDLTSTKQKSREIAYLPRLRHRVILSIFFRYFFFFC